MSDIKHNDSTGIAQVAEQIDTMANEALERLNRTGDQVMAMAETAFDVEDKLFDLTMKMEDRAYERQQKLDERRALRAKRLTERTEKRMEQAADQLMMKLGNTQPHQAKNRKKVLGRGLADLMETPIES